MVRQLEQIDHDIEIEYLDAGSRRSRSRSVDARDATSVSTRVLGLCAHEVLRAEMAPRLLASRGIQNENVAPAPPSFGSAQRRP
jgi:hypothetical protein